MKDILKDESSRDLLSIPAPTRAEQRAVSRAWLYEVPSFYLFLFLFQILAFPERPGYYDLNPSPFWLGILLFGLRYGLGPGLTSGVISAGLYALGLQAAGQGYRLQDSDFLVRAVLFVVVGAIVGGQTGGLILKIKDLKARIADLTDHVRGLQNQILAQQKSQRAVEQQVVSQMSSIVTLYHGSRALGVLDRAELLAAILNFFAQALHADKAALYVPKGADWELHSNKGWLDGDRYPKVVPAGIGLIGRAGSEGRLLSLRDFFDTSEDANAPARKEADALMVAPLKSPTGEVLAVFTVQSMPFLHFNSASLNLLSLLAEWGNEALAKCLHFEGLQSRSILDEDFGVYSTTYLRSRSIQEFSRSQRYALPLTLLLLSPDGLEGFSTARKVAYYHSLAAILKKICRESDVVTKSPFEGCPFALLLVTTSREQADVLKKRVLDAYSKLDLPYPLRVGLGSYRHEMKTIDEIYEEARNNIL